MKKYIAFVFVLAVIFTLNSTANANVIDGQNDSKVTGCLAGDSFSRTTGMPCRATTIPKDCVSGDLFSSITGMPCGGPAVTFPLGCSSNSGYSVITGMPCSSAPSTPSLVITTMSSLPNAQVGNNYKVFLNVLGGPSGVSTNSFTWSPVSLPPGLILGASDSGEVLTGIPTASGTFNFTLYVSYGSQSGSKNFTITVNPATGTFPPGCSSNSGYSSTTGLACDGTGRTRPSLPPATLIITTPSPLPSATVGTYYSTNLNALVTGFSFTNGFDWSLTSGSLPPGLLVSNGDPRIIAGTPTTPGTYNFSLTAIFNSTTTGYQSNTKQFTLTVNPATTVSDCVINNFTASPSTITLGQSAILSWSTSGCTLLALTSNGSNGFVPSSDASGSMTVTPTATTTYTLRASDVNGVKTASATVTVQSQIQSPKPTVTLTANPSSVILQSGQQSDTTLISWSSTNATYCNTYDNPNFPSLTSGSINQSIRATTSFSVSCTGPGGTTTSSITVPVQQVQSTKSAVAARSCNASIYWGDNQYALQTSVSYGGSAKETWSVQGADQVWGDCGDGPKQISTGPQSYTFNNIIQNRTCRVWGVIGTNQNACNASATIVPITSGNGNTTAFTTFVLGAESFKFSKTLRTGSSGEEVKKLQEFLNASGNNPGSIDGIFGAKVKAAVIAFQTANKLKVDGIVGPEVEAVLNK